MAGRQYQNVSYGLNQPLNPENPTPIIAKRNPTTSDFAFPTTIWTNTLTNSLYILASVSNNTANWVGASGSAGTFTSLTVTPGPISLTGTTTINTTGAAATTIGTGGTGAVNIGNATGNTNVTGNLTVTADITANTGPIVALLGDIDAVAGNISAGGTVTAGTGVVATTGGVTATAGDIHATGGNITLGNAAAAFIFQNGIQIVAGAGDPNGAVTAPQGSLFLRTNGTGVANRAWINTNGGTVWTAISTAA